MCGREAPAAQCYCAPQSGKASPSTIQLPVLDLHLCRRALRLQRNHACGHDSAWCNFTLCLTAISVSHQPSMHVHLYLPFYIYLCLDLHVCLA